MRWNAAGQSPSPAAASGGGRGARPGEHAGGDGARHAARRDKSARDAAGSRRSKAPDVKIVPRRRRRKVHRVRGGAGAKAQVRRWQVVAAVADAAAFGAPALPPGTYLVKVTVERQGDRTEDCHD